MPNFTAVANALDLGSRKFWRFTGRRVDVGGRESWLHAPMSSSPKVADGADALGGGARFLRWGKPVERLVRDHPGTTLALAAFRPPRTIATSSVWRTVREMEEMVRGRSAGPDPERHAAAMAERERRDFHHEFATYRSATTVSRAAGPGPV